MFLNKCNYAQKRKDKSMGRIIDIHNLYGFNETDENLVFDIINEIKNKNKIDLSKVTKPLKLLIRDFLEENFYEKYKTNNINLLIKEAEKNIIKATNGIDVLVNYLCLFCLKEERIKDYIYSDYNKYKAEIILM